jgi:predicted component of type VI protein secretion system
MTTDIQGLGRATLRDTDRRMAELERTVRATVAFFDARLAELGTLSEEARTLHAMARATLGEADGAYR